MNALFIFKGYDHRSNVHDRVALTVPDGPDDRFGRAKEILMKVYPDITRWSGWFICLTSDEVFKEL